MMMDKPSTWANGKKSSAASMARAEDLAAKGRRPFVYSTLVVFCVLYYYRPEDFIPVLNYIPMARIVAIVGVLALVVGMLGGGKAKVPAAIKILWLLFLQMAICVPFAMWRGGAYATVFEQFSKCVVVAMLISMSVVTVRELRKLLWIQVSAVALVTLFSILLNHMRDGRLEGIQKGILENPNDLAINIAISFPLGLAFLLHGRGFKKVVWILALACMSLGIVLTYSRSGLLAFLMCLVVCVWEFGIRGKRHYIVVATAVALVFGLGAALSTAHYRARVESILAGNVEGSGGQRITGGSKGTAGKKHRGCGHAPSGGGRARLLHPGGPGLDGGAQQLYRSRCRGRLSGAHPFFSGDWSSIPEYFQNSKVAKV